jgi:putative transposase
MALPQRKRPAKGVCDDERIPTVVFLTVCTANRRPWLADDRIHKTLSQIWCSATHREVGPYVLMPDHLHLFARPGFGPATFDRWVQYWKSMFGRAVKDLNLHLQSGCFHHRIRSWEGAEEKRRYMMMNPVRAGLVATPEEWPFRGEIFPTRSFVVIACLRTRHVFGSAASRRCDLSTGSSLTTLRSHFGYSRASPYLPRLVPSTVSSLAASAGTARFG